jgi:Clp amino terminal domain, pathogenicity island component
MFERFTDRARRVVVLAQEEARLLDHNYIGTEHILLGLIHEGEGLAAQVLVSMDISLATVRAEVEEIIGHGGQAPSGHIPFTPRSKKVLEMSLREALQLGHNYIGTEHILLGLIREGEGVAAQILTKLGADLSRVRQAVVQQLSGYQGEYAEYHAEPRVPRPQIRPVRCGFCNVPSPVCGTLYTGVSGALICESCIAAASPPPEPAEPQQIRRWRSRLQGMVGVQFGVGTPPGSEHPEPLQIMAARHEPVGPPPEDEEAARRAIEYAFTDPMELAVDGTLVNVEDGVSLKQYVDQVLARAGTFITTRINVVELVKFIDATRAVVYTRAEWRDGTPLPAILHQEGWAVLVDGRWKVSRETILERWAQAGVVIPPSSPPAPTD